MWGDSTRHKKGRLMHLRGYPLRNASEVLEPEDRTRESSVRDHKGNLGVTSGRFNF